MNKPTETRPQRMQDVIPIPEPYPFNYDSTSSGDLVDLAQQQTDLFNKVALRQVYLEMNRQKTHALEQSRIGMAGICEKCGNPIPRARLRANIWATRCVNCQKDYERDNK